jgi:Protein of Unknown function (DUF2784)
MWYLLLADAVALVHVLFVLFVIFGSIFVLRWPRALWVHAPALVWGVIVECAGMTCPLTPLENRLRLLGGQAGYAEDFLSRWISTILYPASLTRELQMTLGASLLLLNIGLYAWILRRSLAQSHRLSRSA